MNQQALLDLFQQAIDPLTGHTLQADKAKIDVRLAGNDVHVTLTLGYPAATRHAAWQAALQARAQALMPQAQVHLTLLHDIIIHKIQDGVQALKGVKNVIAVGSGKGGVGKSTVAANLALALVAQGARVGLLDADIYGPSVPTVMGVHDKPEIVGESTMKPLSAHGLQLMSVGFMVPADSALVWRGPMITQALEQMFKQTAWDNLDYLIVDLPPGTGDIQLSMTQKLPVTGAVIVTTPQDLALADAVKAVSMFEKVKIPVFGVVENMAVYCCPNCGHTEHIFGQGGGKAMAQAKGLSYLGALPLAMRIRSDADAGKPTVVADPQGDLTAIYRDVAVHVAAKVAALGRDFSHKFGSIAVQKA